MATSPEIDALVAQAKETEDVMTAAAAAFVAIAAQLEVVAGDKAASLQLATDLKAVSDTLASAIVTPPAPPPAPVV